MKYGNACGAIAVSRHLCSAAYPTPKELDTFLEGVKEKLPSAELDAKLDRLHQVTTRTRSWPEICVLAFDHRRQVDALVDEMKVSRDRISEFKNLIWRAAASVMRGDPALGNRMAEYGSIS